MCACTRPENARITTPIPVTLLACCACIRPGREGCRASSVPLELEQVRALDLLDSLTNDAGLHLNMELRAGDIQLVHNHTLPHDRTAFEDWPEPERKRHLLRLWLASERARPLPRVFEERYGSIVPGERGGIVEPGTRYTIPWEPEA
jgi:Taurine catabolism dioxygenase TauD, TfdA family